MQMKKLVSILLIMNMIFVIFITGCSIKDSNHNALRLEEGILLWDEVKGTAFYEVDMGSGSNPVYEPQFDIASKCDFAGTFHVVVRAVDSEGKRKDVGSLEITTKELEKPIIKVVGEEDDLYFVWNEVEGATSYSYDAHDGKGIQIATKSENGDYRVPITNITNQMIRVLANGNSKGNELFLSGESTYTYKTNQVFDMSLLAKHQAVYTSNGELEYELSIGTNLDKGVYDVTVSMYVMNLKGHRLQGNGTWGRRIEDSKTIYWLCDNEVDGWKGSGGTIPNPDETYKTNMQLEVDRGGNAHIKAYDFNVGDRLVIADIEYKGKSVINKKGGAPNPMKEVPRFDLSTVDKYLAVFRSPGGYYDESPELFKLEIPVDLPDGTHTVSLDYCVCTASGDMLEGNGVWGRRIAGEEIGGPYTWLNEYEISGDIPSTTMPKPTEMQNAKFSVKVKNKKFILHPLDFNVGEMLIVSKVKTASVAEKNGLFVSTGALNEQFKVKTTLSGKPRHTEVTLTITYKVHDVFGNKVVGNGAWGRRMSIGGKLYWFCEDKVKGYPEAKDTIPNANQELKEEFFFYEINKYGVLTFNMFDFEAGDVVEITSIKYNGKEILVK